jgi:hypothetical protein
MLGANTFLFSFFFPLFFFFFKKKLLLLLREKNYYTIDNEELEFLLMDCGELREGSNEIYVLEQLFVHLYRPH